MKNNLKATFWFLTWSGFSLGLAGCVVTIVHPAAEAGKLYSQDSYPPLEPSKVFFFPSKGDFPPDFKVVQVADLKSPPNSDWDYEFLVREFQKKAGDLGANAVVLERVDRENAGLSSLIYKGTATAYRLTGLGSSEASNLKSCFKATQNPDPPAPKSKVIYSYPGMSAQ